MSQLKIAFVLDGNSELSDQEYKSVIQKIRYNLYELRNFSFQEDINFSLAFVKYGESSPAVLYDLDTFSINKENQVSIFQQAQESDLKDFFCLVKYSETGFEPSKVMSLVKNPAKQKPVKAQKPLEEQKQKSKDSKFLKIIILVLICCIILTALPSVFYLIKQNIRVYKKVYTGDGDRLILRTEPAQGADELIRLNEDEVVQLLSDDGYWAYVEYHGFSGYVKSQYLIEAKRKDYIIDNPDSMYNYGLACLNFDNQPQDGESWIKKAADQGLLLAQWEMKKIYREDEVQNLYWLETVAQNNSPYEMILIPRWIHEQRLADEAGNSEVVNKYEAKINERSKNIDDIKFAALSKLAWEYLDKDPDKAGEYFLQSFKWGKFTDGEFIESLVNKFEGQKRIEWLEKAYAVGSTTAAWELAEYYWEEGNQGNAVTCYESCYNANYKKSDSAGRIYDYYKKSNSKEAFKWLQRAFDTAYSGDYYYYAYYLGKAYEYGEGCEVSYYNAMNYYKIAKAMYPQAENDYNRVYNNYYYYYW